MPTKQPLNMNEYQESFKKVQAELDEMRQRIDWGPSDSDIPIVPFEKIATIVPHGSWLVIDGYVVDISEFLSMHPGGEKLLRGLLGKDGTSSFYGILNVHTRSAGELVKMMRVAKVLMPNEFKAIVKDVVEISNSTAIVA
jgi:stearoyl-CoA desaturase (Delta-9 desaturase)